MELNSPPEVRNPPLSSSLCPGLTGGRLSCSPCAFLRNKVGRQGGVWRSASRATERRFRRPYCRAGAAFSPFSFPLFITTRAEARGGGIRDTRRLRKEKRPGATGPGRLLSASPHLTESLKRAPVRGGENKIYKSNENIFHSC